jgi:hypothetical protein
MIVEKMSEHEEQQEINLMRLSQKLLSQDIYQNTHN